MTRPMEDSSQTYVESMLDMRRDDPETVSESSPASEDGSEVTGFYDGLNILVTGGSGFLGKLLVEKLLRTCPKIGKLYMFMRPKKGKTSEERFKEHFNDVLYDRLKREQPRFTEHVVMVEGDTSQEDLGLSEKDRQVLVENTHVVFHGAATVRFDESLRRAIGINVRGTKLVLLFAKEMRRLKAFVHISTAFSHCIFKRIEEKFYEPPMDPDRVLALIDMLDDELLEHITPKVIGKWPNTYAFSKAIGEELVRRKGAGMPLCIVRPSIMIATYREPMPGWINNYYGPTGVVMGAGVGLLRSLHCERDKVADIIPADYVINNIIVAAWDTANKWEEKQKATVKEDPEKPEDPPIYNSVSSCQKPINWGRFMHLNEVHGREVPSDLVLWYYAFTLTRNLWLHNIFCFLFHTVPAVVIDLLAVLSGREPMLLKAYRKIHKFSGVISYFSTQQWEFGNGNVLALWQRTSPVDRKKFYFNLDTLDWDDFFFHHVRGLRVYIMKDPLSSVPQGRRRYRRLRIAHYFVVTGICLLVAWLLFHFCRLLLSLF
ncbi:fatty acyl-CoA reductase wat-like [Copidosoma floridanum]|uniref:fatty acyl-CoA reductase wat-like n=1 Tax=Copidosoma floridanum TaxID=29053 RepID=UPI0006C9D4AE|nr:fatty acyl-CoA reductase wat-like [Copidosoma floridanum]